MEQTHVRFDQLQWTYRWEKEPSFGLEYGRFTGSLAVGRSKKMNAPRHEKMIFWNVRLV